VAGGNCTCIIPRLYLLLAHSLFTDEELAAFLHLCGRGPRLIATTNHRHFSSSIVSGIARKGLAVAICPACCRNLWLRRVYNAHCRTGSKRGAVCERRYQVHKQWYKLRPDALAEYRVGSQQMRFWLEWDRGTMNVHDLAIKFTSYAHYIASREWEKSAQCSQRWSVSRLISGKRGVCCE